MGRRASAERPPARFLLKKPGVGEAKNYGFNIPQSGYSNAVDSGGSAIEAMRGWPGSDQCRENDEEGWGGLPDPDGDPFGLGPDYKEYPAAPREVCAYSGVGSNSKRRRRSAEALNDPHMIDLMAHTFMREGAEARLAKAQAEKEAEEERERVLRSKHRGVKGNKTATLRQIHNGVKLEKCSSDLWKLPKFEKEAKPHLSTFRNDRDMRASKAHLPGADKGPMMPGMMQMVLPPLSNAPMARPTSMDMLQYVDREPHDDDGYCVRFDGISPLDPTGDSHFQSLKIDD